MIRILLVDDQKSIRERLKSLLETEPDFDIVGMVDNGYDAIEQVKLLLPDVVLMDMEMPDIDGVLATKIIAHSSSETKVLVLTSYDSHEYVAKSIYAGAKGYILKGAPADEIREAVRFVNRGYMQIAPGLFEKFMPTPPHNNSEFGSLEYKPRERNQPISLDLASDAATEDENRPGKLELTGIGEIEVPKSRTKGSDLKLDRPSKLIVDITALNSPRKSIGWYQAAALVVAGLGLTYALYLLRQGMNKPADVHTHHEQSLRLQDLPFTGKIEPVRIFTIDASIPGPIEAIYVKVGQSIAPGQRLLTIRNTDAERTNHSKIQQQQQLIATQKQAAFQQIAQQQQQLRQQQQISIGERQAAAGRIQSVLIAIANYQRNLAPLRQQVATANIQVNIATQPEQLPIDQKRIAIDRAQAIYDRTLATYQRLTQYQTEGAISQARVEQAEQEMTVAKSDLQIAQSDYERTISAAQAATIKQAAQTQATRLQQQLTLEEQAGQLQQLQAQLNVARSDYQQIESRLQQIQQQQAMLRVASVPTPPKPMLESTLVAVLAPIAGTVLELPISQGDRVFTGHKLLNIADPKKLKIGVDLQLQQAALLKLGQRAVVKVGTQIDSQEAIGAITKIAPPIDRSTQHIEVEFTHSQPTLLVGQIGTVYFSN
jgi:hemolysin D